MSFFKIVNPYLYGFIREINRYKIIVQTKTMPELKNKHFIVKFKKGDEVNARLVLATAEKYFEPITRDLNFSPSRKVMVIVHSSQGELNHKFGWPAQDGTMGVYWAGVIQVLSPGVWIADEDLDIRGEIFSNSGPMAHEFTHLVLDYITKGNYPRWFTEGVAQYEEFKLTGFVFPNPDNDLSKFYSFNQLDKKFDLLPDQSIAYRQSFLIVYYLIETYGKQKFGDIINNLSSGHTIDYAIKNATGLDWDDFENEFFEWTREELRSKEIWISL